MITTQFDYVAPATLDDAVRSLSSVPGACPIAGGQGLIHAMKGHRRSPALLVDLRHLATLRGIRTEGGLSIGAMTTLAEILDGGVTRDRYHALGDAVGAVSDPQVRNRATIGGCLADAHPEGHLPAAALALEARLQVTGPKGVRVIDAQEFFVGAFTTSLEAGEIVTTVEFPAEAPMSGSAYLALRNPASGFAVCGVAAALTIEGGKVRTCRLAITGATDHAMRLHSVEKALEGLRPEVNEMEAAARLVTSDGLSFVDDLAAAAEYRAHLAVVLAGRAMVAAARRAGVS